MKLPGENRYISLQTEGIAEHLKGQEVSNELYSDDTVISYPAYIIAYGDVEILPHSLDALEGLLDARAEDKGYVYVAQDFSGTSLKNLVELGAGDKYLLDEVLIDIVRELFDNKASIFYTEAECVRPRKLDMNNLRSIKLEL